MYPVKVLALLLLFIVPVAYSARTCDTRKFYFKALCCVFSHQVLSVETSNVHLTAHFDSLIRCFSKDFMF